MSSGKTKMADLARINYERVCCNGRYAVPTSVAACSTQTTGRLAPRSLNSLAQVCLGFSGLRVLVSHGVLAVLSRTVMNNVGQERIRVNDSSWPDPAMRASVLAAMITNSGKIWGASPL
jgi:hypothetical protein